MSNTHELHRVPTVNKTLQTPLSYSTIDFTSYLITYINNQKITHSVFTIVVPQNSKDREANGNLFWKLFVFLRNSVSTGFYFLSWGQPLAREIYLTFKIIYFDTDSTETEVIVQQFFSQLHRKQTASNNGFTKLFIFAKKTGIEGD